MTTRCMPPTRRARRRGCCSVVPEQDMSDTMFEESEVAKAVREMRTRDPTFDMVSFLRSVRGDVQPVIQARAHWLGWTSLLLRRFHEFALTWWMCRCDQALSST